MTMIPEGTYNVRVLDGASVGTDYRGEVRARISVQFLDGEQAGQIMVYDERWDARTAPYVTRSLKSVGWKGRSLSTVAADVVGGVETQAEVTHLEVKKEGPRKGEKFAKLRSLGGATALDVPTASALADADSLIPQADNDSPVPF